MFYTIKNDRISVTCTDIGGELMSIKSADNTEYLWQGDSKYWAGRAYNLFPIVGRLTEGKYTYKGTTYEMNLHGFARKSVMQLEEITDDKIVFVLCANESTLKNYPFDFEFKLIYKIDGATVSTCYEITNRGKSVMPFAVGGHPGFNVPLTPGEKFEDYYIEFAEAQPARQVIFSAACLATREEKPYPLKDGKIIELKHSLFDNDAIVLKGMSRTASIKSKTGSKGVTVSFPGMKYVGMWHTTKSDAPFVCIEPWISLPAYDSEIDDLETKEGMVHLEAGKKYTNGFDITVF